MSSKFDSAKPSGRKGGGRGDAPWVLVAGGFHHHGGMDKPNAALASYLLRRGTPLHLVAHHVSPEFTGHPLVTLHLVPRRAGSFFLGEQLLARRGRAVAEKVTSEWAGARVVVNGGNCVWPDVNWVHYVHHAWRPAARVVPAWVGVKNALARVAALRGERRALGAARLVIANSARTRRDLIEKVGVRPERVRAVYYGAGAGLTPVTPGERAAARAWLKVPGERPLAVFVGAIGHDLRKGLDTLVAAWKILCSRDGEARLIVAGGGRALGEWRARVGAEGLSERITFLGFSERIAELLAAADLLVSPVRYEAYGLNVQEAICRGVPALVSGGAGAAEHYTPDLSEMLLPNPDDAGELAARLLRWRYEIDDWKRRFAPLGERLRRHTWIDMAAELVSVIEGEGRAPVAGRSFVPLARGAHEF
ncbi:MAG: glycosyltransferase family 4 protein [Acidobacteriota bacterium]|nr:glycosyltransferase family 4 protein [Acidobacteriota bacterium]